MARRLAAVVGLVPRRELVHPRIARAEAPELVQEALGRRKLAAVDPRMAEGDGGGDVRVLRRVHPLVEQLGLPGARPGVPRDRDRAWLTPEASKRGSEN